MFIGRFSAAKLRKQWLNAVRCDDFRPSRWDSVADTLLMDRERPKILSQRCLCTTMDRSIHQGPPTPHLYPEMPVLATQTIRRQPSRPPPSRLKLWPLAHSFPTLRRGASLSRFSGSRSKQTPQKQPPSVALLYPAR